MTPALPIWNCEFQQSTEPAGPELNALTVGSLFVLKCEGDIAVNWNADPINVLFAKKDDAHTLAVIQPVLLEPNQFQALVSGYKAGEFAPEFVRIVQGEQGFEFTQAKWQIQSVLKPNEPAEAYPPFGPWGMAMPLWVIFVAVLVLGLFCTWLWRFLRRHSQRKKMLAELEKHKTAISPLHQFYRDARQLRRRIHQARADDELKSISQNLDREFRLYILRQFQIPTLDWSDRAILEDLRKRHRKTFMQAGDPLKKVLRELRRLAAQDRVLLKDVEQMQLMSIDVAEKLDQAVEVRK